jgi:pimeloyl-ACP methyl ester carboxylesterase
METIISKDGTRIACERTGSGPAVVLVGAAMTDRQAMVPVAKLLAARCTVFNFDRRGRGDSGDTLPYAVEREIEDIEAVIDAAGGSAFAFGGSSGGSLAMEAAVRLGAKVRKLAIYEAPYHEQPGMRAAWGEYLRDLTALLAADRRGDAVARFMKYMGMPEEQIQGMRRAPMWPKLEAIAPTLAYDHIGIMGKYASIPGERARLLRVPVLVMNGGAGAPFMHETAIALGKAIPGAQVRTLEGQTHAVSPEVLAPVLAEFFGG